MDKKRAYLIAVLLIVVVGTCVYTNSLHNPFIWDDFAYIVNNLHIRHIGNVPRLFKQSLYHQDMVGRFYRPILSTSFALDYRFWGLEPFGYHLTNLFLHLANAVLIFYLLQFILGSQVLFSFLAALFFVIHPVHTEAVTYIGGRADPLAAFFCLISLISFIRYINSVRPSRRFYYVGSILSFIFGLLTKETAAILPFTLFLYEASFRKAKFKVKEIYKYIPFLIVLLSYGLIRQIILSGVKEAYLATKFFPLSVRLLIIPLAIASYFKMLVFPLGLHMERMEYMVDPPASLFEARVFVPFIFLILFFAFVWQGRRNLAIIFFGAAWFLLNLLPVLNIVPINAFVAEHWLYMPSIGFFLVVSYALNSSLSFKYIRPFMAIVLIGIFATLCLLTIKQNRIWREPIAFYRYTLKYAPQSSRLHVNLAGLYMRLKSYEEAAKEYEEVLKVDPFNIYAHLNYGVLYEALGKEDEAMRMYEKAIEVDASFAVAFNYIGNIHYRNGRYRDAIKSYHKAVELNPTDANCWDNLASAYLKARMLKEAAESYEKALGIYRYLVRARVNLGGIYAEQGNPRRALEEYERALKLAPRMPVIYYNIANAYAQLGNLNLAKEYWEKTLELDPNYVDAIDKLDRLK